MTKKDKEGNVIPKPLEKFAEKIALYGVAEDSIFISLEKPYIFSRGGLSVRDMQFESLEEILQEFNNYIEKLD